MISYAPLWRTLSKKGITQYQLINEYGVSTGTLDALRKNRSVTLNTIQDLCKILDCSVQEVVEITFESGDSNNEM
ncbi:helix-turn-helix transcriptional regulator [Lawsonibacter hominis]|uniref:helix-turn-helix domain-containing protein n=1 Tax=Lawsonibacter hominis TaxID=2763053 RepID=UPI00331F8815